MQEGYTYQCQSHMWPRRIMDKDIPLKGRIREYEWQQSDPKQLNLRLSERITKEINHCPRRDHCVLWMVDFCIFLILPISEWEFLLPLPSSFSITVYWVCWEQMICLQVCRFTTVHTHPWWKDLLYLRDSGFRARFYN